MLMGNPFPGMNPYLEQPELWHQAHNRLIVAIADDLTPQIVPKYRVSIEACFNFRGRGLGKRNYWLRLSINNLNGMIG
jgi:Protein of unknown function (DUF4058)